MDFISALILIAAHIILIQAVIVSGKSPKARPKTKLVKAYRRVMV